MHWRRLLRIRRRTLLAGIAIITLLVILGTHLVLAALPFRQLRRLFPRFRGRPVVPALQRHNGNDGDHVAVPPPNRVLVFMTYDASASRYGNVAAAVNELYARKMGFAFRVYREGSWPKNVRSQWGRYFVLLSLLKHNATDYDLLVYIDSDSFVVRPDVDVRSFAADPRRGEHIVFGNELWVERWFLARAMARHARSPVNSGAIVVRTDDAWAQTFFDRMINAPRWQLCSRAKQRRIARYFDQACIDSLLREGLTSGVRFAYLQSREGGLLALRDAPLLYHVPVNILQNTFSDRTHCIAQLRPASSFLLSALVS